VLFHLQTVSGVTFGPFDPLVHGADTGVFVFFALSGYLLYKPFVAHGVDLPAYGAKRAGRILPGYLVALVGLTVLTGNRLAIEHPLPYLAIASSYDLPLRGFLGNAWTLSAEVLFYVSLPLIARWIAGRELARLSILALASVAASLVHTVTLSWDTAWLVGTYPVVFYAFVPGMALAVVERRRPAVIGRLGHPAFLAAGISLIAAGALLRWMPIPLGAAFGTPLVMGWLLNHRLPAPKALAFAGGASYALYLWHKDLFIAFGPWVGLAITVVAAVLSWWLVERPILARVHWWTARRSSRQIAKSSELPAAPLAT
jgi:peptidoglycan/LPS O-acetylase OafA/YrhL